MCETFYHFEILTNLQLSKISRMALETLEIFDKCGFLESQNARKSHFCGFNILAFC